MRRGAFCRRRERLGLQCGCGNVAAKDLTAALLAQQLDGMAACHVLQVGPGFRCDARLARFGARLGLGALPDRRAGKDNLAPVCAEVKHGDLATANADVQRQRQGRLAPIAPRDKVVAPFVQLGSARGGAHDCCTHPGGEVVVQGENAEHCIASKLDHVATVLMNTRHNHREEGVDRLAHELRTIWERRELLGQRGEAGSVRKDGSNLHILAQLMGGFMHGCGFSKLAQLPQCDVW